MSVDIIVGLQWGSEGKGKLAALLAENRYACAIRSGGPNSGHTIWHKGAKYITRHIPSAWVDPNTELFICAGAAVSPDVLASEISALPSDLNIPDRLVIDRQAAIIQDHHIVDESILAAAISSTAHGVGAAYRGKMSRLPDLGVIASKSKLLTGTGNYLQVGEHRIAVDDVSSRVHDMVRGGKSVMIEGTQGALLSLDHGDWPWVTSRNVTSTGLLSDAGLGPWNVREIWGALRTFPIRVGGPSGPMPGEISWDDLSFAAGHYVEPERTTVTNKVRRIAKLDPQLLRRANSLNGCTHLWVSFCDYLGEAAASGTPPREFFDGIVAAAQAPVRGYSWGPKPEQSAWW